MSIFSLELIEYNCYYEKIGKSKVIKLDNLPFEIPDNWSWIRLSSFCDIYTGDSINENDKNKLYRNRSDGYDYIGTKDVNFNHSITYENGVKIPYNTQFKICPKSKILLCIEGGSAGRKIAFTSKDVCFGNKLACFNSWTIDDRYLYLFLQSPLFLQLFKDKLTGIISGVSLNNLKQLFLPLPPLDEQERIVEKFKSCEPLLSRYELIEQNITLLETSFEEKLKASILQYAIEGKLVKQDSNDEPASMLLERIKAEKERLIKQGKIKREKTDSSITVGDDKNYYHHIIPETWRMATLGDICNITNGFTPSRSNIYFWNKEINWLTVEDINAQGKYVFSTREMISKCVVSKNRLIPINSIILCCTSASIGKLSINKIPLTTNQQFNGLTIIDSLIDEEYLYYYCSTLKLALLKLAGITTFPFVSVDKLKSLHIPIPPLNEQKRISHKIRIIFNNIE